MPARKSFIKYLFYVVGRRQFVQHRSEGWDPIVIDVGRQPIYPALASDKHEEIRYALTFSLIF